jgi:hypothetical protein
MIDFPNATLGNGSERPIVLTTLTTLTADNADYADRSHQADCAIWQ